MQSPQVQAVPEGGSGSSKDLAGALVPSVLRKVQQRGSGASSWWRASVLRVRELEAPEGLQSGWVGAEGQGGHRGGRQPEQGG